MTGFLPGQALGQYEIVERIGHGGMATVYKARQPDMDRNVAIKVIESQFMSDPEILARFQQEVRVISRLEHPHILPVYDFGEFDSMPFLVMRLLEGGTLSAKLKGTQLTMDEVDAIFSQLADALSYAHEKGVVHRDVKTNNVLLDSQGNAFLTDFGIAKLTEGTQHLTSTGTITGTPSYMSPEQAMGRKVGPQADIFSLGVVLFEMLTGKVPFTAETPLAVMLRMVNEPLPAPSTINQNIHPVIEKVVLKALVKETSNRYLSVQQFLKDWKAAYKEAIDHPYTPDQHAPLPASQSFTQKKDYKKKPRMRKIPRIAWFLSILLVSLLSASFFIVRFLLLDPSRRTASAGFLQQPGIISTESANLAPYIKNLIPAGENTSHWQTWGAGNDIKNLSVYGEYLFAGSPGGLTIWDTTNQTHTQISTQNGLPGPIVNEVIADEDDTIWVATNGGLVHLFQNQIQTYLVGSHYTSSIIEYKGQFILGTMFSAENGTGLYIFDGTTWNPMAGFPSDTSANPNSVSPNVTDMKESSDGSLWVGTERGVAVFDGNTWQVLTTDDGLLSERIVQIFQSDNAVLYAVTTNGISFFNETVFNPLVENSSIGFSVINCMEEDIQGNLWIGGEGGVAQYTLQSNTWEVFNSTNGYFPAESVTSIAKDQNGGMLFGSNRGVFFYKGNRDFQVWTASSEVVNSSIQRILPTPDNKIWFINDTNAFVGQFDPASLAWSNIRLTESCCMIPMVYDSDGTLLGGGQTGLWIISGDTTIHLTKNENMISDTVTSVRRYGDQKLIIGTDIGVMDIDGTDIIGSFAPSKYSLPSDHVTDILVLPDGTKWVGLKKGLIRIKTDFSIEPFSEDNLFSSSMLQVSDMAYDSRQRLWISTMGDGIYMMENEQWHHYSREDGSAPLPSNNVLSVSVDQSDVLWFGLGKYGGLRFDGQNWEIFNHSNGMPLSSVNTVLSLPDGSLWFAGDLGITRFNP